MRAWCIMGVLTMVACSTTPIATPTVPIDGGPPALADGSFSLPDAPIDSGVEPDVTEPLACDPPSPLAGNAGDTCLAHEAQAPCSFLCDAGAFYSCLSGELPANAGVCAAVDAGGLAVSGTSSLCCGTSTCVRYAPADSSTCGQAWSCPAGSTGLAGATSTGAGPTSDTVIWCM